MLGFPLGILSAAGAEVGVAGAYELIETQVLDTAVSSITFSSLATYASVYKHLQIRAVARGTNAAAGISFLLRMNGDSGNNYADHGLEGNGSSVTSYAESSVNRIFLTGGISAGAAANSFTGMVIDILDPYSTTKNTTARSLCGSTGHNRVLFTSGLFINTDAVTSFDLFPSANNWVAGSRFSLYGIKG